MELPLDADVNENTIDTLLDPVKVAILLGTEIPVIPQMSLYLVLIMDVAPDTKKKLFNNLTVTAFDTLENAEQGLLGWVAGKWEENLAKAPWYNINDDEKARATRKQTFFHSHSRKEIVDRFFSQDSSRQYYIGKRRVSESTEPLPATKDQQGDSR